MKYKYISISLIVISLLILLLLSLDSTNEGKVGLFLSWAYILLGVALVAAIGIPLVHIVQNPEKIKKVGIYAGLALGVLLLSILFSSSDPIVGVNFATDPSPGTLQWTEAGLIATYILLAVAFGAIIVGGIINIRNR
ncbi:MAG: hypothetical protein LBT61_01705 [Prevotellaceae bacterium]|jgi:hypothetical protein|nr:hypothetical protein [Prevotellaceae bacterium]